MSKAPIWHVATDALVADTTHLSAEEFGAYIKLMMAQWRNNGNPLENDPHRLARISGLTPSKFKRIFPTLLGFFEINDNKISQKRVEKDFKNVLEKISKNKANGKKGGEAKSLKSKELELANGTDSLDSSLDEKGSEPPNIPEPEPEPYIKELSKEDSSKKLAKQEIKINARRSIKTVFGDAPPLPAQYLDYARKHGHPDPNAEWETFVNFWQGNGEPKRDWFATWRNRVLNSKKSGWYTAGYNYNRGAGLSGDGGSSIMDITAKIIAGRGSGE